MHAQDTRTEHRGPRLRTLGVTVVAVSLLITACGGTAAPAPSETAAATAAKATVAPATSAPAATQAAAVVNVEAYESGDGYFLKADTLVVAAGPVTFNFKNAGKLTHELMVYPVQDIGTLLTLHRADKKADEEALLKSMAGMAEDVDAGKSASFNATLKPGFYELGCHARSKDAMGMTYTHFDKGQFLTLAVTGPGGPSASVTTPASTLAIEMTGDEKTSWLFSPDRLVVSAGEVTFKVTNNMKAEHDFVVSPIGDTSKYVAAAMMPGMTHNDDYSSFKGTELLEDLAPGKTESKTFKLTPGLWVAACYMTSTGSDGAAFLHRDHGQRFVFMVK
jgi:uncharacterized cupredoxin-like copper-binding protein